MIWLPTMFWQFYAHQGPPEAFKDACGHFQCLSVLWTCEFEQQKKFSNQPLAGKKVLSLMIGFPKMFCPFHAHEGLQEVFQVACGHFQYLSVLWTCEFEQQKKVLQQTLGRQKSSLPHDWVSKSVVHFMPMKDYRKSFKLLVGTSNIFLCFEHVN